MHDIKALRDNPAAFDANWARRGLPPQTPAILELDEKLRKLQTELQTAQSRRNEASKEIGAVKSKGGDAAELMAEVANLKDRMAILEEQEREVAEKLNEILSALPNMIAGDVPDGADENDNVEIRTFGTPKNPNTEVPDHVAIGEALGLMDFEGAAKVAGARFSVNKGGIAKLHRALGQLMLDTHTMEHGYTEIDPPLLVSTDVMYGTTQLPKFRDDQFETTDGRWLIPTAEVVLTNLVRDEILEGLETPIRMTAMTPSFRKEAGSAGKDTRGIIRQHQFYKVEMVSITRPEDSEAEHLRMLNCAENILKKLELPFRTIVLCSGDMGFASRKTYDIEVWIPSQQKFREISSCSNCGDIQSRRMKARFKRAGAKDTEFVHTLNGSGLAVGRTLVAVMENYYDPADGGIFVPKALLPYMGGVTKIVKAA
ncbi:MAG: serine--tRNA ligase [Alphaproteobacteria bacterium RIFCSPHIGHO2_02_FULL_46_13]|nr:MAG: serine--tRNA ligase [Alphaproteobacteria bacterium RIFCSPHIGHO2_02_FULL_46_13]